MKRPNVDLCRSLRRNRTDAEKRLWSVLRNRQLSGVKFRRQFSFGRFILDFYSPEYDLCIEADGGQHYEDDGILRDQERTDALSNAGIQVLRFSNLEILNNIEGVCEVIRREVEKKGKTPSPLSSHPRGEEVMPEAFPSPLRGEGNGEGE